MNVRFSHRLMPVVKAGPGIIILGRASLAIQKESECYQLSAFPTGFLNLPRGVEGAGLGRDLANVSRKEEAITLRAIGRTVASGKVSGRWPDPCWPVPLKAYRAKTTRDRCWWVTMAV